MKFKNIIRTFFIFCIATSLVAGNLDPAKDYFGINPNNYFKKNTSRGILERTTPRSVVKINLSQLAIKNLSFQYEFSFERHLSISIGYSNFLSRPLQGLFVSDDPSGNGLRNANYKGFAITPEIRFYPGVKVLHQAPHGFYLAGYLRYANYTLTSGYNDTYNGQAYGYNLTATYKGSNIGLMIGYQWIIAKRVSLDFWILGGGFGTASFNMNANANGVSLSPGEQASVKQSIQNELSNANFLNASNPVIETTDHSVTATMNKLPMLSLRGLGLCLGIAF